MQGWKSNNMISQVAADNAKTTGKLTELFMSYFLLMLESCL